MDPHAKEADAKTLADKENRLRHMYGKLPTRSDLLHHQLDRTYFDSGDFALTTAHKASNIGKVQTGTTHALVENVSHPSAPVPTSSNVTYDANKNNAKDTNKTTHTSQLGHSGSPTRDTGEENLEDRSGGVRE